MLFDLKREDARAEARILRVIGDAAIGNHEVTEKKVIEDAKGIVQSVTTANHLPPHLNVVKKWLK